MATARRDRYHGGPQSPSAASAETPAHPASFQTGIKSIDTFTPLGRGQRLGIFAGSGVGKSTLLGMMASQAEADVNVIALIGERGREVREFLERDLDDLGRKNPWWWWPLPMSRP